MKLTDEQRHIERIGYEKNDKSEQFFRIATNAQTFKLLSDKIYSRKVQSVLRELSCNSYDAHSAANNLDTPFIVTLPNYLNNGTFSIRDFGVAMDQETIEGLYCTYGWSNKNDSNQFIGQLGLGSKSPFCLVDNFTVISWIDGRRLEYLCYINENGVPTLSFLSNESSDEPRGVQIQFAIDSSLFDEFAREAKFVFSLFKPTPIIEGNTVVLNQFEPQLSGEDWMIGGNIDHNYAVMGNVTYNLQSNSVYRDNIYSDHNILYYNKIILFFEIGELDITASREELSYTTKTIESVRAKVDKVKREIKERLEADISTATTFFDACKIYAERHSLYTRFTGNVDIKYKGKIVRNSIDLTDCPRRGEITITRYENAWGRSKVRSSIDVRQLSIGNVEFYINDSTKGCDRRCRQYYLGRRHNLDYLYVFSFSTPESRQEFLDFYEIDDAKHFKKVSDLPAPVYDKTPRNKPIKAYTWNGYGDWVETSIPDVNDKSKSFYFVKLYRWQIQDNVKGEIGKYEFKNLVSSLRCLTEKDFEGSIVGIRDTLYKKIVDTNGVVLSNWHPVSELIQNEYNAYVKKNKLHDMIDYLLSNDTYYDLLYENLVKLKKEVKCPQFQSILEKVSNIKKWEDYRSDIVRLTRFIKGEEAKKKSTHCINDLFDDLCVSMYPMLEHVKNYYHHNVWKSTRDELPNIISYINTIYRITKEEQNLCSNSVQTAA